MSNVNCQFVMKFVMKFVLRKFCTLSLQTQRGTLRSRTSVSTGHTDLVRLNMSAFSIPILGEYPSGNNVNECSDGQGAYDEGNINWRMSGVSFWDRDREP